MQPSSDATLLMVGPVVVLALSAVVVEPSVVVLVGVVVLVLVVLVVLVVDVEVVEVVVVVVLPSRQFAWRHATNAAASNARSVSPDGG